MDYSLVLLKESPNIIKLVVLILVVMDYSLVHIQQTTGVPDTKMS